MQSMKKNKSTSNEEVPKQKERHIVSWSQEEWYTYLNSDFKKGGWSPEEDSFLCERRTDNAVKNRFSTLCKKRAKPEALAKENNTSYINPNNKRVIFPNGSSTAGISENATPLKKLRRTHISDLTENCTSGERLLEECGTTRSQQLRPPFSVLQQTLHNVGDLPALNHINTTKEISNDASSYKIQGTFLKRDDPKIFALMQQAELLSSLAVKVNTENMDQSLENTWKVLQDFLNQNRGSDMLSISISDMDFQLENFKDLVEDLRSSSEGSHPSWRQPDLYEESPYSSEYSTGSTLLSQTAGDKMEESREELCALHIDSVAESQSTHIGDQIFIGDCENGILSGAITNQDMLPSCEDLKDHDGVISVFSNTEFGSPHQVTPIFRSLAAGVPSPKFSESERQFLLKALGMDSQSSNPSTNYSQPSLCKRALLQSL
ncbi:unnamed protein product [Camellia sinensis]